MALESGPVLIVVSEDGLNQDVDEDEEKEPEHKFKQNNKENRNSTSDDNIIKDLTDISTAEYNYSHYLLGKCNSFPIADRNVKDHLRVPSTFSNYETASSVYSSGDFMEYLSTCGRCMSETRLRSSSVRSSSDEFIEDEAKTASALNLNTCDRDCDREVCHYHNRRQSKEFQHTPLKRTVSAPLKATREDQNKQEVQSMRRRNASPSHRFQLLSPRTWKKRLSKLHDQKSSNGVSRWSLRRTLSHSFRSSFSGRENGFEITFPTKNKKKPRQKYRIVEARTGQKDGISFEVIGKQGTYLRVKGSMLIPDKDTTDSYFNKDCTFVPLPDMWFSTFFAFESVSKPSYFIRLTIYEELVLDKYDGTTDFKEEASFQLNRKPCATCLQVGVQTWARKSTGEYCLGKVVAIGNKDISIKFEDGKIEKYSKSDTRQLLPDVVPSAEDIHVGTRVVAQWLQRDTALYPGVVSNIRSGETFDVLFDDGDTGRGKPFQIRLMRTYSICHDMVEEGNSSDTGQSTEHSTPQTHDKEDGSHKPVWTPDSSLESPPSENTHAIVTPQDSGASLVTPTRKVSAKNFTFSPWEIETISQDSGYHGCDKGNSDNRVRKTGSPTGHLTSNRLNQRINLCCPNCSSSTNGTNTQGPTSKTVSSSPAPNSNNPTILTVDSHEISNCSSQLLLLNEKLSNEEQQCSAKIPLSRSKNVYRTPSPRFHPRSVKQYKKRTDSLHSSLPNVNQCNEAKHKPLIKTNSDPINMKQRRSVKCTCKQRVKFENNNFNITKNKSITADASSNEGIEIDAGRHIKPLLGAEKYNVEQFGDFNAMASSNGAAAKKFKTFNVNHMAVIRERADSISQSSII